MTDFYMLLKFLHIVSVISWMAGLLYLPRLFAYHAKVAVGSEASGLFKVMEQRLLKIIMLPAMISTWVTGLFLFSQLFSGRPPVWMEAKLLFVVFLTGVHGFLKRWARAFFEDRNVKSERFFRFINELPTVLMLIIVFLVVLKPFS